MAGYVRKMAAAAERFVAERRARGLAPEAADPSPYGASCEETSGGLVSRGSSLGGRCLSVSSLASCSSSSSSLRGSSGSEGHASKRPRLVRQLSALALAAGVTVAVANVCTAPSSGGVRVQRPRKMRRKILHAGAC